MSPDMRAARRLSLDFGAVGPKFEWQSGPPLWPAARLHKNECQNRTPSAYWGVGERVAGRVRRTVKYHGLPLRSSEIRVALCEFADRAVRCLPWQRVPRVEQGFRSATVLQRLA